jgi:hypothetical protein
MRALDITLKNNKAISSILYTWRPELGYIEVLDENNGKIVKIRLSDITSGTIYPDRHRDAYTAESLLEVAKQEGWEG